MLNYKGGNYAELFVSVYIFNILLKCPTGHRIHIDCLSSSKKHAF